MDDDNVAYTETIIREVVMRTATTTVTVFDQHRPSASPEENASPTCDWPPCWSQDEAYPSWTPEPSGYYPPLPTVHVTCSGSWYREPPSSGLLAGMFFAGFGSAILVAGVAYLGYRLRGYRLSKGHGAVQLQAEDESDDVERVARTHNLIDHGTGAEEQTLLEPDSNKTSWESCETSFQRPGEEVVASKQA